MFDTYKIPEQLISDLEKLFPDKEIIPEDSLQEIFYYAGVRRVIDTLKRMKTKQDKKRRCVV